MPRPDYTKYVHEYVDGRGNTRFLVAHYDHDTGQYTRHLSKRDRALTGCSAEFARTPKALGGGWPTRKQALDAARYMFGDWERWQADQKGENTQ
jgi:hypothetical protein